MRFRMITPGKTVSTYARMFWVMEAESMSILPYSYHAMADSCPELLFVYQGQCNISGKAVPQCCLLAQSSLPKHFELSGAFGVIGVYLYPYMIPKLFGEPADIFSDDITDLKLIKGRETRELLQQLQDAACDAQRVDIVSNFILRLAAKCDHRSDNLDHVIKHMLYSNGNADINYVVQNSYLSSRQFQRKFKQTAGYSATFFNRLTRFQSTIREYKNIDSITLTDIALKCGYYDQSHFIRDFKSFSGLHPKTFFSGNAPGTEVLTSM